VGALYAVCRQGHLELAKWLEVTFDLSKDDVCKALVRACVLGDLTAVSTLRDAFELSKDDTHDAFMEASKHGYLEIAQLLHASFSFSAIDAFGATMNEVRRLDSLGVEYNRIFNTERQKGLIRWLGETFEIDTSC
jgi:hypothetical protein